MSYLIMVKNPTGGDPLESVSSGACTKRQRGGWSTLRRMLPPTCLRKSAEPWGFAFRNCLEALWQRLCDDRV